MTGLKVRIGDGGPVVVEADASSWRLLVGGELRASGSRPDAMHSALRDLAIADDALALDAFGVVCNCAGAWEDDYTEMHGEGALSLDDWLERIRLGGVTVMTDDGELQTSAQQA